MTGNTTLQCKISAFPYMDALEKIRKNLRLILILKKAIVKSFYLALAIGFN